MKKILITVAIVAGVAFAVYAYKAQSCETSRSCGTTSCCSAKKVEKKDACCSTENRVEKEAVKDIN